MHRGAAQQQILEKLRVYQQRPGDTESFYTATSRHQTTTSMLTKPPLRNRRVKTDQSVDFRQQCRSLYSERLAKTTTFTSDDSVHEPFIPPFLLVSQPPSTRRMSTIYDRLKSQPKPRPSSSGKQPRQRRLPIRKIGPNASLIEYLEQSHAAIQEVLRLKDFEGMMNTLTPFLEICQDCQQLPAFCKVLRFLANFALFCQQTNSATFLFSQALIVSELTRNYRLKIKALIGLATCARRIKQYQLAVKLLRKALVYAWRIEDSRKEVLLLDLLGLSYFYLGDIEKAQQYHRRFLLGQVEPPTSYLREISGKYVSYFESKQTYFTDRFSKILMIKLSLPINNRFEQLMSIHVDTEEQEMCDQLRYRNLYNCDSELLLRNICCSFEFVDLEFDQFNFETKDLKFKLREKMYISSDNYTIAKKVQAINRAKVACKKGDERSFETAIQRVMHDVESKRMPFGEIQEQIYMSHLNNQSLDKDIIDQKYFKRATLFFQRLTVSLSQE